MSRAAACGRFKEPLHQDPFTSPRSARGGTLDTDDTLFITCLMSLKSDFNDGDDVCVPVGSDDGPVSP